MRRHHLILLLFALLAGLIIALLSHSVVLSAAPPRETALTRIACAWGAGCDPADCRNGYDDDLHEAVPARGRIEP